MTDFLKTLILVNGIIAVTFGLFIELCKWCLMYHVTPWIALPGTMAICVVFYLKTVGALTRRF